MNSPRITSLADELSPLAGFRPLVPGHMPARPSYTITTEDLAPAVWGGIPQEYHGAKLPSGLLEVMREKPIAVLLSGPPGTGKTRLCWAMLAHARAKRLSWLVGQVISASAVDAGYDYETKSHTYAWGNPKAQADEKIRASRGGDPVKIISEASDIRRHRHDREWVDLMASWPHVLCVDDIGFTGRADDWVQEAVYCLANARRASGFRTVWTTNLDPDGIRDVFGSAIASRLLGGVVVPVEGADRRLSEG